MKLYKPTSAGRRGMTRPDFSMITKKTPEKKFLAPLHKTGGRSRGKISVRFKGGGAKRRYRIIDFGEKKIGETAKVLGIEYDPNRSARIALIEYGDKTSAYIVAPDGLNVGTDIVCYEEAGEVKTGNRMKLKYVPVGAFVYNVEINPGQGGKISRSGGTGAKVLATEGKHTMLAMPSGEVRKVFAECYGSIGFVSNRQHNLEVMGKAGRNRHKGIRPHVRGSAMNPVDHPHGGGEGRAPIGLKHPKTPWGKNAYGVRTRRHKKYSNSMILHRRKNKKRK
ncbi:MAG: 50S ribosomal protein L2 [Candidatus Spechtbacteria bacterium RIFCSPHIGHO2_02_FULL_43_15b]|uniref:Large ribosomal subunit protein uL2 n=1 Tax=Candidatus Spechtbacteria bacterium RIFCSPHIGHO2_01_FULL_43_30 TaxID=1802158 RepID=A0A1G2H8V8_9BACT|nr:MAG: 50S ribosomal protein L2 [Candidatus Spechtbacteria bacterium RIFCSPHIGHO2_01_FULL_43_30]OGZ59712.1 MAG: 50S ribosomal protein L2 [Candidatus Spechtbacteria bacterium RIFCSPHIGHO2_02_FULL_43_15b]